MPSAVSISSAVQKMKDAVSGTVRPPPVAVEGVSPYSVRNWEPQAKSGQAHSSTSIPLHFSSREPTVDNSRRSNTTSMAGALVTPATAKERVRNSSSEPSGLTPSCSSSSTFQSTQGANMRAPKNVTTHSSVPAHTGRSSSDTQITRSLTQTRNANAKTAKAKATAGSTPVNKQLNKDISSLLR